MTHQVYMTNVPNVDGKPQYVIDPMESVNNITKKTHKWALSSLQEQTHKKHKQILDQTENLTVQEKISWLEQR